MKPLLAASSSDEGVNNTINSMHSMSSEVRPGLMRAETNNANSADTHVTIDQVDEQAKTK